MFLKTLIMNIKVLVLAISSVSVDFSSNIEILVKLLAMASIVSAIASVTRVTRTMASIVISTTFLTTKGKFSLQFTLKL